MKEPMFKLTVAVPIYNTELYLEDTLLCIENQTLGMENMQVILVNDGSTDSSGEICHCFQEKYDENVEYIEYGKNQGVSHAKNVALQLAKGAYITFWDSDDLWSLNAMEEAVAFLDVHKTEIDMVSSNIEYFESYTRPHILNFDVSENVIIDIQEEYQKIRTVGPVCVMRTEAARLYRFDESQRRWEDAKYINQLLLRKKKYGMLAGVHFYYRRRQSEDSATQSHIKDKQYYLHDLEAFFSGIYKESMKQCGEFLPTLQYLTAYTLGYFFSETAEVLNEEETKEYDAVRKKILLHIEDRYLKEIPNAGSFTKWTMFALKYGLSIEEEMKRWRECERNTQWISTCLARTKTNYNILKKWFCLMQQGKRVAAYFEKNEYNRVAIYGMSDLGIYLLDELKSSSVQVVCGIDKRAGKLKVTVPVLTVEDVFPKIDVIVVTAVYFWNEIDELLRQKVTCPVISLEDILYSIE